MCLLISYNCEKRGQSPGNLHLNFLGLEDARPQVVAGTVGTAAATVPVGVSAPDPQGHPRVLGLGVPMTLYPHLQGLHYLDSMSSSRVLDQEAIKW